MTILKNLWSGYRPKFFQALIVTAVGVSASGQSVIITPDIEPALAAYLRRQDSGPPPLTRLPQPPSTPYQFGGIVLHARLNYSHLMAEGLPVQGARRVSSEIRTISAGISADLGDHWTLDYNPSWTYYTAQALSESFDQFVSLSGAGTARDWSLGFSQTYTKSKPTLVETARQTEQQSASTGINATYHHSEKLQLKTTAEVSQRSFKDPTVRDLRKWSGGVAMDYQISAKLGFNFGPDFHYTEVADGPDMYGGGLDAIFNWHPVPKLSATVGGGMDYTKSNAMAGDNLANPRFNFSVSYQPFETTSISLGATRSTSTSFFRNRAIDRIRWSAGLNQRLLQRFFLSASYTRSDSDYTALTQVPLADRSDETEGYNLRLSTRLFKRLSAAAVWRKSENSSNAATFSFSSTQYGIELGYHY